MPGKLHMQMCSSQEKIHKSHFWLYIRIPFFPPVYITFAPLSHNWLLAPNSSQTFSAPSSFNTYFPDLQTNASLPSTGLWHFIRELWVIKRCNEYVFVRSLSVDSFINKRVSRYSKESLASLFVIWLQQLKTLSLSLSLWVGLYIGSTFRDWVCRY